METKHTKGPWEIERGEDSDYIHIGPIDHRGIQHVVVSLHDESNAYLISAAPELLDALEGLCGLAELRPGHLQDYKSAVLSARAAIAKATGSQ